MKRRQGYTLIELVIVLLLLILVAAAVFTLAGTGSQTYLRLAARQSQSADLRTGLSYLEVQIRKYDARGALAIRPDPFAGKPALVIEQNIEGKTYTTWIYIYDGYLCELFIVKGAKASPALGSRIVPMNDLQLVFAQSDSLKITLTRQAEGQASQQVIRVIHLQAGGKSS